MPSRDKVGAWGSLMDCEPQSFVGYGRGGSESAEMNIWIVRLEIAPGCYALEDIHCKFKTDSDEGAGARWASPFASRRRKFASACDSVAAITVQRISMKNFWEAEICDIAS